MSKIFKIVKDTNPSLVSTNVEKLELKKASVPLKTSIKLSLKNVSPIFGYVTLVVNGI